MRYVYQLSDEITEAITESMEAAGYIDDHIDDCINSKISDINDLLESVNMLEWYRRKINEKGADKMIIKNEGFTGYIEKCSDGFYVDVAEVGGADFLRVLKSYGITDQYIESMSVGERIEFTDTVTESIINKEAQQ